MGDQAAGAITPTWVVPPEWAAARLDGFVRHCLPHLSRRSIHQAIAEKSMLINGRVGRKGDHLLSGDRVSFCGHVAWLADHPLPTEDFDLPVIYEDGSILVLDKPGGVPTHGFSARGHATVANRITAGWPYLRTIGKSRWEAGLVHRLDAETSGLIVAAKTQAAFANLHVQFRRHEIDKTYWALVWGDGADEGVIDFPLEHDSRDRRRMRVAQPSLKAPRARAWPARTRYRKLDAAGGLSLLEIHMATGVTHQIRVHLAAVGQPIVGDALYGIEANEKFGLGRHFLHAKALAFRHPDDHRRFKIEGQLARDLVDVLGRAGIHH